MKNLRLSFVFVLFSFVWFSLEAQPEIIAHRGYWKAEGAAQNSIAALLKADSIGVYGSEVDISITADGVPVCNHDADIEVNGKKVIIEENNFDLIRQAKLSNGESVPSFEEYLDAFSRCKRTKLIIELKPHKSKSNEDKMVETVVKMVKDKRLEHRVEYISFAINIVTQIKKLAPEAAVYYLNGDLTPSGIKEMGLAGSDYYFNVYLKYPQWIKRSHELGLKINVWTVNEVEDIRKMIDLNVDFITTDEPLLVRELIDKGR